VVAILVGNRLRGEQASLLGQPVDDLLPNARLLFLLAQTFGLLVIKLPSVAQVGVQLLV